MMSSTRSSPRESETLEMGLTHDWMSTATENKCHGDCYPPYPSVSGAEAGEAPQDLRKPGDRSNSSWKQVFPGSSVMHL